ncbi:hypothetical protein AKJ16_DCAP17813 [Drosera capensis]
MLGQMVQVSLTTSLKLVFIFLSMWSPSNGACVFVHFRWSFTTALDGDVNPDYARNQVRGIWDYYYYSLVSNEMLCMNKVELIQKECNVISTHLIVIFGVRVRFFMDVVAFCSTFSASQLKLKISYGHGSGNPGNNEGVKIFPLYFKTMSLAVPDKREDVISSLYLVLLARKKRTWGVNTDESCVDDFVHALMSDYLSGYPLIGMDGSGFDCLQDIVSTLRHELGWGWSSVICGAGISDPCPLRFQLPQWFSCCSKEGDSLVEEPGRGMQLLFMRIIAVFGVKSFIFHGCGCHLFELLLDLSWRFFMVMDGSINPEILQVQLTSNQNVQVLLVRQKRTWTGNIDASRIDDFVHA